MVSATHLDSLPANQWLATTEFFGEKASQYIQLHMTDDHAMIQHWIYFARQNTPKISALKQRRAVPQYDSGSQHGVLQIGVGDVCFFNDPMF